MSREFVKIKPNRKDHRLREWIANGIKGGIGVLALLFVGRMNKVKKAVRKVLVRILSNKI